MKKENRKPSLRSTLNPTILKLGFISFFADVASEMLYPITPIFLTTVLGASTTTLGIIEGCAEGIASLLKTYSGRLSDRTQNRTRFIWIGYLLAALAKPFIGFSTSWTQVFFARSLDRVGKGIRTAPRDALLSEVVTPERRGFAFGFHRAMDSLGAMVGPLLAIYFIRQSQAPEHLRAIYIYAFIPGLASVLLAFSLKKSAKKISIAPGKINTEDDVLTSSFKTYLIAWGAFSIANSSDVFLLLKVQRSGVSLVLTIVLYAFYNLIYALSSPLFGYLSDSISRKKILVFGLLVFGLVYLGFGFASKAWHFWALFAVYGLYMGATDGVGKAYAIDLIPAESKATGLGMLGTVTGLTTIIASSAAGLLWDKAGSQWTFFYGAFGALIAISVLLFLPRSIKRKSAG